MVAHLPSPSAESLLHVLPLQSWGTVTVPAQSESERSSSPPGRRGWPGSAASEPPLLELLLRNSARCPRWLPQNILWGNKRNNGNYNKPGFIYQPWLSLVEALDVCDSPVKMCILISGFDGGWNIPSEKCLPRKLLTSLPSCSTGCTAAVFYGNRENKPSIPARHGEVQVIKCSFKIFPVVPVPLCRVLPSHPRWSMSQNTVKLFLKDLSDLQLYPSYKLGENVHRWYKSWWRAELQITGQRGNDWTRFYF